ncbi:MAG TPA: hypothetical protein VF556_16320 [Pyrinomonadaceae bacterium]|jgi:hypothetical protein
MLIRITVFLTATAIVWFLFAAFRLRFKNADLHRFSKKAPTNEEGLDKASDELSIFYLEGLLEKLERQLEIISFDFASVKSGEQAKAVAQAKEINEKILVVKEAIEQVKGERDEIAAVKASNISRFQKFWKNSITSFAVQPPSGSNWLYVSSSHNGLYRTVHFGNSSDKSNL